MLTCKNEYGVANPTWCHCYPEFPAFMVPLWVALATGTCWARTMDFQDNSDFYGVHTHAFKCTCNWLITMKYNFHLISVSASKKNKNSLKYLCFFLSLGLVILNNVSWPHWERLRGKTKVHISEIRRVSQVYLIFSFNEFKFIYFWEMCLALWLKSVYRILFYIVKHIIIYIFAHTHTHIYMHTHICIYAEIYTHMGFPGG